MFDVASEHGAGGVTVAHVVERSGVSRRTFYEIFSDREECFLAAFEQALAFARERVVPAYEAANGWREQIRAGLLALLVFLDEQPVIGRLLIAESLTGGSTTLERRARAIERVTWAIDQGRAQTRTAEPASLTAEGVVGGVLSVISARLLQSEREPLVRFVNPLMSMIVLPYLGAAAARRELSRPIPAINDRSDAAPLLSDPFKDAGLRLTYRTVRVLAAIADHPHGSNRLIGGAAEITDQGQISKLLARLERSGLIVNTGVEPGRGGPNAWSLTPTGMQVVSSITNAHASTSAHTNHRATQTGGEQG